MLVLLFCGVETDCLGLILNKQGIVLIIGSACYIMELA